MTNSNIFATGQFAGLFNSVKTHVFQYGSQQRGKSGVAVQRDGRLKGLGTSQNNTEIALEVLADPVAASSFDRLVEIMSDASVTVEPGGDDEIDREAAEFIQKTYVDRNEIRDIAIESLALAKITGCAAHENNYSLDSNGKIYVKSITPIDSSRIIYEVKENAADSILRIETFNKPFEGELPPPLKLVDYRYYSAYINNPYGLGVGSLLIDVVDYKHRMVELWVKISERYSTPIKIANVPETASMEEVQSFFEHFKKMSEGATFVLPPDFSMEVNDISSTGANDLLMQLIDYADQQIACLLLGEYLTGREIANGAQARDAIATKISKRKALSLLNSIAARLNQTTVTWLTYFNFPKAKPPRIEFAFNEDLDKFATRLLQLNQLGLKFDTEWLANKFGVKLDETPPRRGFGDNV